MTFISPFQNCNTNDYRKNEKTHFNELTFKNWTPLLRQVVNRYRKP